jgi:hypothetical protein
MWKITLGLLAGLVGAAHADEPERKLTDVLRWDAFPGPAVEPPVREGEAFVASPVQSSRWDQGVSFVLAPVVRAEPTVLVVQGPFTQYAVPGAFVAPPQKPAKLAAGRYVLFQEQPTLTRTVHVGRVKSVSKTGTITIEYEFMDEVQTFELPVTRVRPLDATVSWGQPVSFLIDGERALGWYIAPGRDGQHWVRSVSRPYELESPKPLQIKAFKKGAKVLAMTGTTSVMKGDKQQPARQYLQPGTVVAVKNRGLTYKVKFSDGEVSERAVDEVFAP